MLLVDTTTAEHSVGVRVVIEGFLRGLVEHPIGKDAIIASGPALDIPDGLNSLRLPLTASRQLRLAYQRIALPWHMEYLRRTRRNVDRVLLLDAYLPVLRPFGERYSVFIHDLLTLSHPYYWSRARLAVKQLALNTVKRSDATILTSTPENASNIEARLGRCATVARFGCGQLLDEEAESALTAPQGKRGSHLLFIGSIERRKGLATLIDSFAAALPRLDEETKLIIVGRSALGDDTREHVRQRVVKTGLERRIVFTGQASREKTLDLLRTARALVYPSEAEGFGLPVLESLALGTPVVTTNIPAIKSWAGDSVVYAEPNNRASLTEAILAVTNGGQAPVKQGQELSAGYRWRSFAENLVETIDNPAPPRR